jgi:endo-beta-N-acetylglucosaminidase D
MKNLSSLLLKNGIKTLIEQEESSFKKTLTDCLSLKLNDAINDIHESVKEKMFESKENTEASVDLTYFASFVENYDSKISNRLKLKNQSYININESDFDCLVELFNSLSAKNRKTMIQEVLENPTKLKQHIDFYNKLKGLK